MVGHLQPNWVPNLIDAAFGVPTRFASWNLGFPLDARVQCHRNRCDGRLTLFLVDGTQACGRCGA